MQYLYLTHCLRYQTETRCYFEMNIEDPDAVNASLELVREFWGLSSGRTREWQMGKGGQRANRMSQRLFSGKNTNFIGEMTEKHMHVSFEVLPIVDTQHRLFRSLFEHANVYFCTLHQTRPTDFRDIVAEAAKLPSLHDLSPNSAIKSWCMPSLPATIIKQRISNGKLQGGKVTIHHLFQ